MPFRTISLYPPPWYHAVCAMLSSGSVILTGNMGRIIKKYTPNSGRLRQEILYETARIQNIPSAPSRLKCTFVCPTEVDAIEFALTDAPKMNQWYLVEPIDAQSEVFVTSQSLWIQWHDNNEITEIQREYAAAYWTHPEFLNKEILYNGPLRIIKMIDNFEDIVHTHLKNGNIVKHNGMYMTLRQYEAQSRAS